MIAQAFGVWKVHFSNQQTCLKWNILLRRNRRKMYVSDSSFLYCFWCRQTL